jgi:RNA recognition motif-containing protein
LYFLFSQYGEILDIVTKKSREMRGQAFIVFRSLESATAAKSALQNFNFFDKPIVPNLLI